MRVQVDLPTSAVDQIVERIFASCRMTRTDQARFMSALLCKNAITDAERHLINRVFDGLRRGLIKVVD